MPAVHKADVFEEAHRLKQHLIGFISLSSY